MSFEQQTLTTNVLDPESSAVAFASESIELSVVMPCLNEQETLSVCVRKALASLRAAVSATK